MKHAVGRCALATLVGKIDIVTYRGEVKGWHRRISTRGGNVPCAAPTLRGTL